MLEISSYLRKYSVSFFDKFSDAFSQDKIQESFFIIDQTVYKLYREHFKLIPQDSIILIEALEENKSYEKITPILLDLIQRNIKKNQKLIVIGGGIIQDIGCFIAHIYRRGLNWEFYPTTFLAQSDSCIGSKSSINIGTFKNQIGTFYPPNSVTIVCEFLNTLKQEDIYSGIGEVIKLAVIESEATTLKTIKLLKDAPPSLTRYADLIKQSLIIKKRFIEEDEFDTGIRNTLNLGHTFGHAFEVASNFKIPHGIAVHIGVHAACFFSENLKLVSEGSFCWLHERTIEYVGHYKNILKALDTKKITDAFRSDKKNTGDKIKFILPHGSIFGNYKITPLELNIETINLLALFIKNY